MNNVKYTLNSDGTVEVPPEAKNIMREYLTINRGFSDD
jgi:hypothetical protein